MNLFTVATTATPSAGDMLVPMIDRKVNSKFKFKHALLGLGLIALTATVIALAI